jgi:hypothetical protein
VKLEEEYLFVFTLFLFPEGKESPLEGEELQSNNFEDDFRKLTLVGGEIDLLRNGVGEKGI